MKRYRVLYAVVSAALLFFIFSCSPSEKSQEYDETLIIGKWECSDGYFYDFRGDHKGRSYDKDDRGLDFEWELSGDELQIVHHGSDSGIFVSTYIITSLTVNSMNCYNILDKDEKLSFHHQ